MTVSAAWFYFCAFLPTTRHPNGAPAFGMRVGILYLGFLKRWNNLEGCRRICVSGATNMLCDQANTGWSPFSAAWELLPYLVLTILYVHTVPYRRAAASDEGIERASRKTTNQHRNPAPRAEIPSLVQKTFSTRTKAEGARNMLIGCDISPSSSSALPCTTNHQLAAARRTSRPGVNHKT